MHDIDRWRSPSRRLGQHIKIWAGLLSVGLLTLFSQGACNCNDNTNTNADGGSETVAEKSANSLTQIRFITPIANEIISGQIVIEAEIIDGDGIDTVQFWANDKSIAQGERSKDSTPDKPRYFVQVATSFLPRGVVSLTVKTRDVKGDTAEKTIQVTTRERWVAPFGVGQVRQLKIRKDRHIYVRLYRSEDDLARVLNPGPTDKVGAAIVTANAVGQASWLYLGIGEEFSPFALDDAGNLYFGARSSDSGKSRLAALGPGDIQWGPEIPIKPKWETDLKEWLVQGQPLRWAEGLWTHLVKPAQGGNPAESILARFKADDGSEAWRYAGPPNEAMEIIRGPFLFGQGSTLIVSRKAGTSKGFRVEAVDASGKSVWSKAYADLNLNVVQWDEAGSRLYIGSEGRDANNKVRASALLCIDPAGQKECWRKEFGRSWPERISLGKNLLFVARNPEGGTKEVLAMKKSDGAEAWKKTFERHRIVGLYGIQDDACFVFSEYLDVSDFPDHMLVERYSDKGSVNWRYENKQFTAKHWLFVPSVQNTLWVIVRGISDDKERLGSKLMALDNRGKRLYLFSDEDRKFQLLDFFPKDSLFLTSRDLRDARIHHLIPIK